MLDVVLEGVGGTRLDAVDTFVQVLKNLIRRVVHDVCVVTGTSRHLIDTSSTIKNVIATERNEYVVVTASEQPVKRPTPTMDGVETVSAVQFIIAEGATETFDRAISVASRFSSVQIRVEEIDRYGTTQFVARRIGSTITEHVIGSGSTPKNVVANTAF